MRHGNMFGLAAKVEMGDLAGLIAPRKLLIGAGENGPIFPLYGVEDGFEIVEKIYAAEGKPENCRLVVSPVEHRLYAKLFFPALKEMWEQK